MEKIKDKIFLGTIVVLIILLIGSSWRFNRMQNKMYQELQEANRAIVEMDRTTKEKDGQYAKLVDYFNSERDLNRELKNQNRELYKLIKSQDEKLLMMSNAIVSLQGKDDEGDITQNEEDTTVFDISLRYPNSDNPFINWDGSIFTSTQTYRGKWSFGELPLQIVMTETERGLWKSRLIGPEWLIVDSISVKSLPPQEFDNTPKRSNFGLLLGGGYVRSFDQNINNGLEISAGLQYKSHLLMLDASTTQQVGFKYIYKFNNFRKKN